MIPPANILLTNYCNQNCPFCFARKEMGKSRKNRDMELNNLRVLIRKMKRSGNADSIRLLGGEPTIHVQFKEAIRLCTLHFPTVQIFTNGVFSDDVAAFLNGYPTGIRYVFNIMTPGFSLQPEVRALILRRIAGLPEAAHIAFSMTIDPRTDVKKHLGLIPDEVFRRASVLRIGLANPMKGEHNFYTVADFPRVGSVLGELKKTALARKPNLEFVYGCGFTRCMFSSEQYAQIAGENSDILRFGCHGKKSSMDITTGLQAFHCFPLSNEKQIPLRNKTLEKAHTALLLRRYHHWQNIQMEMCRNCPFYGIGEDKCPGPCIAFRQNDFSYGQ